LLLALKTPCNFCNNGSALPACCKTLLKLLQQRLRLCRPVAKHFLKLLQQRLRLCRPVAKYFLN
jgi:chorismate mutase